MTSKTLCRALMLLSPLTLPAAVQSAPLAVVQSAVVSGPSAPITLALPSTPTVGNTIYALVGYGIYGDRTFYAPDSSWTCNRGAGGSARINTCSHIVVAGDDTRYTFVPSSTDGPGVIGIIFEASGTVSAQIAYSYSGMPPGYLDTTSSPSLTPSTMGTLPVSVTFGGDLASPGQTGWKTMQSVPGLGAFVSQSVTKDTTSTVSTTFHYVNNNEGSSLQELILLVPGTFAAAPTATPAGGSYPTAQQVVLTDSLPGAVIHYTVDGSTASCASATYTAPVIISSTSTLSYMACASGYADSAIQTGAFVIAGGTLAGVSLGPLADLHGYTPFAGDLFHQDISTSPVDANSSNIISGIGSGHLHHDWSSVNGGNYGIPYTVIDSANVPLVPYVNQEWSDESDVTLYPIPTGLPIESAPPTCTVTGDNHAIILDKRTGVDYEFYRAQYCPGNTPIWQAVNGVLWDMTTIEKRPYSFTSVDAAGLSVFEGLVRYDEIVAGAINHALRFTTLFTRCDHYSYGSGLGAYVAPATHAACNNGGTLNVMGMRIRLKANFDISGYSTTNQIILTAMKKYGMILADNGSSLFFQGTPDARWNDDDLQALDRVGSSNFEVIQMPPVYTDVSHPTGAAPTINSFVAVSPIITSGQSAVLAASVNGASYSYIDNAGFMRGSSMTVSPTQTTTYTLTSRNAYGTTSASTTVTVIPAAYKLASLAIAAIANQTIGSAPFALSATSLSPGQITYSVVSGPASAAGNMVTVTGVGTVVLQASQAASGLFSAATATATFAVNGLTPTLAFSPIGDMAYGASPFLISASSNSPATIAYSVASGPASITGRTVSITGSGPVVLQANQDASGNYVAAKAMVSFTVKPVTPTLSFSPIAPLTYGAAPFTVSSVSNSTGGNTYSVVDGPAVISGNVVMVTGAGKVTLMVSQAAAGNYAAATATTAFKVLPATPVMTLPSIPAQSFGIAPFVVNAVSTSNGPITYAVVSGPAAVFGNIVTLKGAGVVTLSASQAATNNYVAASATTTFKVVAQRASVTLQLSSAELAYLSPVAFEVRIVANGGTMPTGSIQILDGGSVIGAFSMTGPLAGDLRGLLPGGFAVGRHTMTAVYLGDDNYQAGSSSGVSVIIDPKPGRVVLK